MAPTDLPEAHAFIACTLDGFIAGPGGEIEWLTGIPAPKGEDGGYAAFIAGMDAILMGRGTWEKVRTFDPWPYALPVTVASRSLPQGSLGPANADPRPLADILADLGRKGHRQVYVDGGKIISALLAAGLMTRLTITFAPVVLGGGLPLFSGTGTQGLRLMSTRSWAPGFVQTVWEPGRA